MRVDEARNDDPAGNVDFRDAFVSSAGPDDAVAADGDVGGNEFSCHEIEEATALEDDIGRRAACALVDQLFKSFAHGGSCLFNALPLDALPA